MGLFLLDKQLKFFDLQVSFRLEEFFEWHKPGMPCLHYGVSFVNSNFDICLFQSLQCYLQYYFSLSPVIEAPECIVYKTSMHKIKRRVWVVYCVYLGYGSYASTLKICSNISGCLFTELHIIFIETEISNWVRFIYQWHYKNIESRTACTIVPWPNPKQWVIVHTSDLMMIIRQSIYIL